MKKHFTGKKKMQFFFIRIVFAQVEGTFADMKHKLLTPKETLRLQKKVISLERRIMELVWSDRSEPCSDVAEVCENKAKKHKLERLLMGRCLYLNKLFKATDDEVERFSKVNDMLRKETSGLDNKMSELLATLQTMNAEWLKDVEVEIELYPVCNIVDTTDEDNKYYCSDFQSMIQIECDYVTEFGYSIATSKYVSPDNLKGFMPRADKMDTEFENWNLCHSYPNDMFNKIKWCYATHQLAEHLNFPFVDIIRLKEFNINVRVDADSFVST